MDSKTYMRQKYKRLLKYSEKSLSNGTIYRTYEQGKEMA